MLVRLLLLFCLLCPWRAQAAPPQQSVPAASVFFLAEEVIGRQLDRSDGSEYRIERLTRLPDNIILPMGTLEMVPELVGAMRYNAPVQVKIALSVDGMPQMNLLTFWRVRKFVEVLVTARDIPARTKLVESDVVFARREVARLDDVIFDVGEVIGLETKRVLTAGSIVSRAMLGQTQVIKAGSNVLILSKAGTVVVQVAGQALQGGGVGDVIRVRNLGSGKNFLARIEGPGVVIVTSDVQ